MLYVIDDPNADVSQFTPFAVVGGDHHIHAWKYPDPETRISASMGVLAQGAEAAQRLDVPLIVNGDLTHDKNALDPMVTSNLMGFFREMQNYGIRIILSVGNHERTEKYHTLNTLQCFEPVVDMVASSPRLLNLTRQDTPNGLSLMLVPFYYNHKQAMVDIDHLQLWDEVPESNALVFVGHYPVDGAEINGIKPNFGIRYEDFRPDQFAALLFNDIHKAQPVSEKAYHLGCTHQNTFGEEGYQYGWWAVGLWGDDPNAVTIARLPTIAPEFQTVEEKYETLKPVYMREKPSTVIARTMEAQGAPRIQFDQGDLGDSIQRYLAYRVQHNELTQEQADRMRGGVAEIMRVASAPGAR